jgi:hypothetical protein
MDRSAAAWVCALKRMAGGGELIRDSPEINSAHAALLQRQHLF